MPAHQEQLAVGVIGTRSVGNFQGGIETYCSSLYSHLKAGRFIVTIFVSRPARWTGSSNVRTRRVPSIRLRSIETVIASFAAVVTARLAGIKLIHVHGIGACLALPLASALGMRAVVRHMGAEYQRAKWGWLAQRGLHLAERCAAEFADTVVCLNPDIAEQFKTATGRSEKVLVVPNGVSRPRVETSTEVLRKLRLAHKNFVLSVGRLVPEKRQDHLIRAFIDAGLPADARLVIAGEADYPSSYARTLRELARRDPRVVLAGEVFGDDLWTLYRSCRIFALPSAHEGMSFALLEACIAGATIVASDIAANAVVCPGYLTLFKVGSVDALADALRSQWWRQRAQEDVIGQTASCERAHDWTNIAAAMEQIFLGAASADDRVGPSPFRSRAPDGETR